MSIMSVFILVLNLYARSATENQLGYYFRSHIIVHLHTPWSVGA